MNKTMNPGCLAAAWMDYLQRQPASAGPKNPVVMERIRPLALGKGGDYMSSPVAGSRDFRQNRQEKKSFFPERAEGSTAGVDSLYPFENKAVKFLLFSLMNATARPKNPVAKLPDFSCSE